MCWLTVSLESCSFSRESITLSHQELTPERCLCPWPHPSRQLSLLCPRLLLTLTQAGMRPSQKPGHSPPVTGGLGQQAGTQGISHGWGLQLFPTTSGLCVHTFYSVGSKMKTKPLENLNPHYTFSPSI